MNKYEKFNSYQDIDENILNDGESVLFDLKPKKFAFFVNKIFYMLPLVIIWLGLDIIFICSIFEHDPSNIAWIFIPFFVIQFIPIFLWFYNVLNSSKRWINTRYIITDYRVIIKNGFVNSYRTIFYKDIANVFLSAGFIDKILGVGDIRLDVMGSISDGSGDTTLLDIANCKDVFDKLQEIIMNNQNDVQYSDELDSDKSSDEDKIQFFVLFIL